MFRGTLRRIIVPALAVGLALVPLATQAAPAGRSGRSPQVERPSSGSGGWNDWSGAAGWLTILRGLIIPAREKDSPPPGQAGPDHPSSSSREGTGIDPHGGPRPVVP
jgi:hypothetical protein